MDREAKNTADRALLKTPPKPGRVPSGSARANAAAAHVAEMAEVSVMTVSRVFNDSPLVSEATRRRVIEAARVLGYQPNLAARALRTGKVESFGFVVGSPASLLGEFHSDSLAAFESVITPRGLGLSISVLPADTPLLDLATRLAASGRVGALAVRLDVVSPESLAGLENCGVPVILANYTPEWAAPPAVSSVGFDNSLGAMQAVRHLAALGHRRVAYLGGTPGWSDTIQRELGFRKGMEENGLAIDPSLMRDADFASGFGAGLAAMTSILASGSTKPTAAVCASDEIAAGAMEAARRWNMRVPHDLSVIGYDDSRWCPYVTPRLTSVRHAGWDLGENMGRMLLQLFDDPSTQARRIVLETRLVLRDSTAPVAPGA